LKLALRSIGIHGQHRSVVALFKGRVFDHDVGRLASSDRRHRLLGISKKVSHHVEDVHTQNPQFIPSNHIQLKVKSSGVSEHNRSEVGYRRAHNQFRLDLGNSHIIVTPRDYGQSKKEESKRHQLRPKPRAPPAVRSSATTQAQQAQQYDPCCCRSRSTVGALHAAVTASFRSDDVVRSAAFIDGSIAVVVERVTHLGHAWIDPAIFVVTVTVCAGVAVRIEVTEVLIYFAITVVVNAVL
jgi:hypothetical protein